MVPDAFGDFRRQPFLDLQPPRETVQHARQLGNAHDMVARQIGDRRLADDRRHVMLAMRLERDVLQQHDLVIAAHFLENSRQMDRRILAVALAIFLPRARHALGRVEQAFAAGIVAGPAEQRADRLLNLFGDRRLAEGIVFVGADKAAHAVLFPDSSADR